MNKPPEVSLLVRLEGRESFLPRSEPKDRIKIAVPRGTAILMRYFVIKIEAKFGENVIKPNRMETEVIESFSRTQERIAR